MEKQRIPADFLIGTSSSAWQIEGCAGKKEGQESWAELFYNTNPEIWYDDVGPKKASDFYHHYKEDIKTCLLYTSPSPRDRSLSRMPSSA